jgi:predicted phosphodiesterase
MTSYGLRLLAALLLGFSAFVAIGTLLAWTPTHPDHGASASLLLLGDTGKVHRPLAPLLEGQFSVAADLAAEDRAHPVDALLLLGDNFYMDGLLEQELAARVKQNLVWPYCHFVALGGARSHEVSGVCPPSAADADKRPIYAVLGNHDYESAESPSLQQDAIPAFVTNWSLSTRFAVNRELPNGLSLILLDSHNYRRDGAEEELAEALTAAKGPWRVLAAHIPMAIGESGNEPEVPDGSLEFQQFVEGAIKRAGVRVHLYVSGHHHSLQAITGGGALGPSLHVVAGSGARPRAIAMSHSRRVFAAEALGFARLDLVERGENSRMVVQLFQSPVIPLLRLGFPRIVARWSIDADGQVSREP